MRSVTTTIDTPILSVSELSYAVRGKPLINRVNLELDSVGLTMVMGPNGAGKSLLLRLLHGLITPTRGEILWRGQPMSEAMRRKQAMVFQRPVLLRRSVQANLEFVLRLRENRKPDDTDHLLEKIGLLEKRDQPARLLSGGEQQRLTLARALALDPEFLFLDEPTASLDPASTQFIEKMVGQARAQGKQIIFITHDIGQARRLADQVIFMHRGEIAEVSNAGSFFKQPTHEAAKTYLDGRLVL